MARKENLYATSHWTFDIGGLVAPDFQKISGLSKKTGEIKYVDGTTNITHKYSSQIFDFGEITATRPLDGGIDDSGMETLTELSLHKGQRFDGQLIKFHNGEEVFRIMFFGLQMKEVKYPDYDAEAEARHDIDYTFSVSHWQKINS